MMNWTLEIMSGRSACIWSLWAIREFLFTGVWNPEGTPDSSLSVWNRPNIVAPPARSTVERGC